MKKRNYIYLILNKIITTKYRNSQEFIHILWHIFKLSPIYLLQFFPLLLLSTKKPKILLFTTIVWLPVLDSAADIPASFEVPLQSRSSVSSPFPHLSSLPPLQIEFQTALNPPPLRHTSSNASQTSATPATPSVLPFILHILSDPT